MVKVKILSEVNDDLVHIITSVYKWNNEDRGNLDFSTKIYWKSAKMFEMRSFCINQEEVDNLMGFLEAV